MNKVKTYSLYWNNISNKILLAQKQVYNHFRINVVQENYDGLSHGTWINNIIQKAHDDEILVFSDIDAFPLNEEAYNNAVELAELGQIFGLAQTANHTINHNIIYAGPMFLCFKKSTWINCGSPSFEPDHENDCGQRFSDQAIKNKIKINLAYPTACIKTQWPLADRGVFGIGTFYENNFFHLFESRKYHHIKLIETLAQDIVNNRSLSFGKYIELINESNISTNKLSSLKKFGSKFFKN